MTRRLPPNAGYLAVPVLGAVWPVLFIAGSNPGEFSGADLVTAVLLAALCGAACVALALAVTRTVPGALVGGLALVALMYSPPLVRTLRQSHLLGIQAYGPLMPVLLALVGVLALVLLRRMGDRVRPAMLPVTLACITLVLLASVQSVASLRRSAIPETRLEAPARGAPQAGAPDIYLIVLDQYASSEVTRRLFGFDNRAFEDSLRSLGFRVPAATWSNYAFTAASIASMLDMRHVDSLARQSRDERSVVPLLQVIARNASFAVARSHGYRIVLVPSGIEGTRSHPWADRTIGASSIGEWLGERVTSPLALEVARLSVVGSVFEAGGIPLGSPWRAMAPLRRLSAAAAEPGPKLVFAHAMTTHPPFLFTSRCGYARERWADYATAYRAQIECTNRRLLHITRDILASGRAAVILFQGDHGTSELGGRTLSDPRQASAAQVGELHGAFSAYRTPDGASLGDTVTPVNLLRRVFNRYAGTSMAPVSDEAWFGIASRPYDLVPVNMRVMGDSGRFTRREPSTGVVVAGPR